MSDYIIVEDKDAEILAAKVRDLIRDGWQPCGGVAATHVTYSWENERKGYTESADEYHLYQAMVRA